ncbi:hypothetical protein SPACI_027860 [Sporomusa acidovorans DSM 3132]|uniref:Uncharacterized protein n=1 Tax=Sporomusa acidovorans (strain ATCC 49682 / DSM 3132 / Mol) TaxID=1123286 RepID=A0ABZ3J3S7_SPOA4|nr:hypothetical protein SAMN04488499_1001159 [Sporomusa acidovorans]
MKPRQPFNTAGIKTVLIPAAKPQDGSETSHLPSGSFLFFNS